MKGETVAIGENAGEFGSGSEEGPEGDVRF